ncbi:DUF6308 family protein, partial [Rhodococcus wratislaviensis]
ADRFTADDQVAVTFLSVQVLTMAARAILDTIAEALNASLRAVDPDRDLVDEPDPLGPGWLAWDLETALRGLRNVGWTNATKLIVSALRVFDVIAWMDGKNRGLGVPGRR